MGGKGQLQIESKLSSVLDKISSKDLVGAELQESKLIYNVVGFLPASDYVDHPLLLSSLGYLLGQKGLNTCVVDLKVFAPNLYHALDAKPCKRGDGLIKVLKSDKVDFREEIQSTKYDRLYLLSPSPHDLLEEYFDFEFEHLERVIETLKSMFDIVLLDIPNIPALEFCLGAMKYCHVGFFTVAERIEASSNIVRMLDFAASVGISTAKFTSIIAMNTMDIKFDYKIYKEFGLNLVAALPFVKAACADVLEGRMYIRDNPLVNRYFNKEIRRLADLLASQ
ncbi:ATPase [Paenibacillus sp. CAA11]|uniref:ATPase n=1 Tax=Paenibacillus sp. CAA11 TaxID=1532905 RepID=UPI000D3AD661|nr:ATPase [Paenibacillus sp. CAA11]AWB43133.1 ATPase [Paenibacillus sp. CAA11]